MGAKLFCMHTAQIVDSVMSNDTKTVLKKYKSEYLPIWNYSIKIFLGQQ